MAENIKAIYNDVANTLTTEQQNEIKQLISTACTQVVQGMSEGKTPQEVMNEIDEAATNQAILNEEESSYTDDEDEVETNYDYSDNQNTSSTQTTSDNSTSSTNEDFSIVYDGKLFTASNPEKLEKVVADYKANQVRNFNRTRTYQEARHTTEEERNNYSPKSTVKTEEQNFNPQQQRKFYQNDGMETEPRRQASERAAENPNITGEIPYMYATKTCESNGKAIKYDAYAQDVNWSEFGSKIKQGNKLGNLNLLTNYITYQVYHMFDSWQSIKSIIIRDDRVVFNNIMYTPKVDKDKINLNWFPVDTLQYIREGAIAPLFDWSKLRKMNNLTYFDCDDSNFFINVIGGDLGLGKRIGMSSLYKICPNLQTLIIGGRDMSKDTMTDEDRIANHKYLSTFKRLTTFEDGYKFSLYGATNAFDDYCTDCLKNYAHSRGDKGIMTFLGGLGARGAVTFIAKGFNFAAHLGGVIKNIITDGMQPIDASDLGGQSESDF